MSDATESAHHRLTLLEAENTRKVLTEVRRHHQHVRTVLLCALFAVAVYLFVDIMRAFDKPRTAWIS